MLEWVLKFRVWVLTVMIGTCIYGILVIDGYLCSRIVHVPASLSGSSGMKLCLQDYWCVCGQM